MRHLSKSTVAKILALYWIVTWAFAPLALLLFKSPDMAWALFFSGAVSAGFGSLIAVLYYSEVGA